MSCYSCTGIGGDVWGVNSDLLSRGYDPMGAHPQINADSPPSENWAMGGGILVGIAALGYFGGKAVSKKRGGLIGGVLGAAAAIGYLSTKMVPS
jgi:hypothetical protein